MAKILFFAPNSAIWVHAFPEALVAEALAQTGHEVVYVTCGEVFKDFCISMSAAGLTEESPLTEKRKICEQCNARKRILKEKFKLKGPDLFEKITEDDLKQVSSILASITRENFLQLDVHGIPIGRLAMYEYTINHKKLNVALSEQEWPHVKNVLRHCLLTLFACERIYAEEQPNAMLVYNALYSINAVAAAVAKSKGITQYYAHAGSNLSNRLQNLFIGQGTTFDFYPALIDSWKRFRDVPCSTAIHSQVTNHFTELLNSTSFWVYSSAKSKEPVRIRERFAMRTGQKLLVAAMSSPDEDMAAVVSGARKSEVDILYPSQLDWIRDLIRFSTARPDLFILIRVHPREFPNRREGLKSLHAFELEKLLTNLPSNVQINWPSDQISLYDLAEETDVFLSAWSSAGKEMSLFGIPVVLYSDKKILYPADLNFLGNSKDDYFLTIDRALDSGWSFERIRKTYRWYGLEFVRATVDISESYRPRRLNASKLIKGIRKIRRTLNPYYEEISDCNRRSAFLGKKERIAQLFEQKAKTPVDLPDLWKNTSFEEETKSLRTEIRRLTDIMYANYPTEVRKGTLREKLLSSI